MPLKPRRLILITIVTFLATNLLQGAAWAQTENILYNFAGGTDGVHPNGTLIMDANGNIYGTTYQGGGSGCGGVGCGTVFSVSPSGTETIIYAFTGGADGGTPVAGVVFGNDGNLYGTTLLGGANGKGTVFKVTLAGTERVLYNFNGVNDGGGYPDSGLVLDKKGNFYGTAGGDGMGEWGAVFKITPAGKEKTIYSFKGGKDGGAPGSLDLAFDAKGNLYGTTTVGGVSNCNPPNGCGTVFMVSPTGKEKVLHRFAGGPDGSNPLYSGIALDAHGNLYGTTYEGGKFGLGTAFKLSRSGNEKVLYSFGGQQYDGVDPFAGVILDKSDNLYGTSQLGGRFGDGTVFKLSPSGQLTLLHSFPPSGDGSYPEGVLVFDKSANLYGTTFSGGTFGYGIVFQLTP